MIKMKCEIKNCRDEGSYTFYNHQVCENCWTKHCNDKINLKKIFNIGDKKC